MLFLIYLLLTYIPNYTGVSMIFNRITIVMILLLNIVVAKTNLQYFKTSFDCNKVENNSSTEWKICTDKKLASLDIELNEAYTIALKEGIGKNIRTIQKSWIQNRDKCQTVNCITRAYTKQLIYLNDDIYYEQNKSICYDFLDEDKRRTIFELSKVDGSGIYDINHDGIKEKVILKGMDIDNLIRFNEVEIYNIENNESILYSFYGPAEFDQLREVLEYKGVYYLVQYYDKYKVKIEYLTYIDKYNIERPVCKFKVNLELDKKRGLKDTWYEATYGGLMKNKLNNIKEK